MAKLLSTAKKIIIKLFRYFLPNPPAAPEGVASVSIKGYITKAVILTAFFTLGVIYRLLLILLERFVMHSLAIDLNGLTSLQGKTTLLDTLTALSFGMYFSIMPFIRYFHTWLKVTGPIYMVSLGYIISFLTSVTVRSSMTSLWIAVAVSFIMCALPIYLFYGRNVTLPRHTAKVTYIAFVICSLGGSIANFLKQIPYVAIVAGKISIFYRLAPIQIFNGIANVIIAFLFMFLACKNLRDYHRRGVAKRYEWLIIFTIVYTMAVIVTKIHEIVLLFYNLQL